MPDHEWQDRKPDAELDKKRAKVIDDAERARRRKRLRPHVFAILGAHFVMAVVYLVLINIASIAGDNRTVEWTVNGLCMFFFFCAMYSEGASFGRRERNYMNYGHLKYDKQRGLKAALISQIPCLVVALAAIIIGYVNVGGFNVGVLILRILFAPFSKVLMIFEEYSPFLRLTVLLIVPTLFHLGYIMGHKGFMVSERLMYKRKKSGGGAKAK